MYKEIAIFSLLFLVKYRFLQRQKNEEKMKEEIDKIIEEKRKRRRVNRKEKKEKKNLQFTKIYKDI